MKKAATATRPVSAAISNESRLKATTGQGQTEKHHGGQDFARTGWAGNRSYATSLTVQVQPKSLNIF